MNSRVQRYLLAVCLTVVVTCVPAMGGRALPSSGESLQPVSGGSLLPMRGEGYYRREIVVDFRVNRTELEPGFSSNQEHLGEILSIVEDTTYHIVMMSFCGSASPEGNALLNRRLARGRLSALESYVRSRVQIPESLVDRDDTHIPWDYLRGEIESGGEIAYRDEILSTLSEQALEGALKDDAASDALIERLKSIGGGEAWQSLLDRYFASMRSASVVFTLVRPEEPELEDMDIEPESIELKEDSLNVSQMEMPAEPEPVVEPEPEPLPVIVKVSPEYEPHLHLGTNALGWLGITTNLSMEVDLCPHLSISVPMYYCAWDYFREDLKFRDLYIQPELKYYFKGYNDGLYAGAHFGVGSYNYAYCGDYRTQDHEGKSPAIGGGVSIGYRMPLSRRDPNSSRWRVSFSLGAGVYALHSDRFHNGHNGLLVDSTRRTYLGLDQANVTFSYMFDIKRKR